MYSFFYSYIFCCFIHSGNTLKKMEKEVHCDVHWLYNMILIIVVN